MTETISRWIHGRRRDGYSGRTGPVFDLARGKQRARGVVLHAIGDDPASHPPFCPP